MSVVNADRNLLFGLLALQNGLIDQDQLVAAFRAWSRDKGTQLAEYLVDRGDLDADQRGVVQAMVGLHERKHGGSIEKSLAAVSAGKSTRESLASLGDPDIEGTLAHVGSGRGSTDDGDSDRTASYAVGAATSDGQRFRVLRPHAQGGLGAVFVALDEELHREVALKQILDHHADDPTSRQRFLNEAEITGGLEHPGIVPVYGLGIYDGGRPYYAMRFIRGDSLKAAIEHFHKDDSLKNNHGRRSLELRKLLRRFIDICNAIDYAHSRGVLHRDIKPGNVIVGRHGETLVVDWGLAKPLGRVEPGTDASERMLIPSSASGSAETLPGSALGTPAYMSPEQAAGDLDRLGPRSDVYSLGATLYCILTSKAPLEGDAGEVLRKVQKGEFANPRQLFPGLDRALEAVCLRAMATRPEERYPSCRALADDVERWAADEPVAAYREPFARRVRRWAKRNRTAVTAAAVALLVGVVGLSAVLAVQTKAKADIARSLANETRANQALAVANSDLTRSKAAVQARYDLAVDAIKTFHTGVSEDFLLKEEKFKDQRDRLLKSAADFYGKLAALLGQETDLASRQGLAASNFELADLTDKVGRKVDALAAHRAVLAIRRELASEPGAGAEAALDVARSLLAAGKAQREIGDSAGALVAFEEALALAEGLDSTSHAAAPVRSILGLAHQQIAGTLVATGKPAAALASYDRAAAIRQALADANPHVAEFQNALAASLYNIGHVLSSISKPTEALASFERARVIQQRLADAHPAVDQFQKNLATSLDSIAYLLSDDGKPVAALAAHKRARAIRQALVDAHTAVTEFQNDLAASDVNIGILIRPSQPAEALASFERARAIFQRIVEANPQISQIQGYLALCENNIAGVQKMIGRLPEALASFERARAIYQRLADANTGVPDFRNELGRVDTNVGLALGILGRHAEAADRYRKATALREALVRDYPTLPALTSDLAWSLQRLGAGLCNIGEVGEAVAVWRRAIALYEGLPSRTVEERYYLACCHSALASVCGLAGSGIPGNDRLTEIERAMLLLRRAIADGFNNREDVRNDTDLDSLRDRLDFQLLLMDMAFPADPLAR